MGIIDDLRLIYLGIIAKVAIFALELHSDIMIFKRKLYTEMLQWKQDSNGASALLIKGQGVSANPLLRRSLPSMSMTVSLP